MRPGPVKRRHTGGFATAGPNQSLSFTPPDRGREAAPTVLSGDREIRAAVPAALATLVISGGIRAYGMALEYWEVVVALFLATGIAALAGRLALQSWEHVQVSRLAREGRLLERWWAVIGELPADALSDPVRRALGAIMHQHLRCAQHIQPDHPFFSTQGEQIARFIAERPAGAGRRLKGTDRQRAIAALEECRLLLSRCRADGGVTRREIVLCQAAVSRKLTDLEFLRQQTSLGADNLRRVTRAIDSANRLWSDQPPASNSTLPTQ